MEIYIKNRSIHMYIPAKKRSIHMYMMSYRYAVSMSLSEHVPEWLVHAELYTKVSWTHTQIFDVLVINIRKIQFVLQQRSWALNMSSGIQINKCVVPSVIMPSLSTRLSSLSFLQSIITGGVRLNPVEICNDLWGHPRQKQNLMTWLASNETTNQPPVGNKSG